MVFTQGTLGVCFLARAIAPVVSCEILFDLAFTLAERPGWKALLETAFQKLDTTPHVVEGEGTFPTLLVLHGIYMECFLVLPSALGALALV